MQSNARGQAGGKRRQKTKAERGENGQQTCEIESDKRQTQTKPKTTQPCGETNEGIEGKTK